MQWCADFAAWIMFTVHGGGGGYAPHARLAPDRSRVRPWSCLRLALVQGARSSRQDQEGCAAQEQDRARGEPGPRLGQETYARSYLTRLSFKTVDCVHSRVQVLHT